jgi:ferrous iron transport protein A
MITLDKLPNGKSARIMAVYAGRGLNSKLSCMNIRKGKSIKKISSQPLKGPIIIEIDNRQCAIGRGIAMKILVKEQ